MKATRQVRSGGTPWWKEDLINIKFLFQHKAVQKGTQRQSHTVKLVDLITLRRNAIDEDKEPAYVIHFEEQDEEWIAIPRNLFNEHFNRDD